MAYTVTAPDWKQDAFVTHVWVAHVASGRNYQLTRGDKSCGTRSGLPTARGSRSPAAASATSRSCSSSGPDGGEAIALTNAENGVGGFAWSPDGKQIAFTTSDIVEKDVKARKDYLGDFEVVRREYGHQHLRTFEVAAAMTSPAAGTERTKGKTFSVSSFAWSPDSARIAFSATANPDLVQNGTADIYLLDLSKTSGVKKIVDQPGPGQRPAVVARRPPDRLLVGDGEPEVLPQQRAAGGGARRWRRAALDHRLVRRAAGPDRLDARRHLLRRVAEDGVAPVPREPGDRRHHPHQPGRLADARRRAR